MRLPLFIFSLFALLLTACGQDYCVMGIGPCDGLKNFKGGTGGTTGAGTTYALRVTDSPPEGPTKMKIGSTYTVQVDNVPTGVGVVSLVGTTPPGAAIVDVIYSSPSVWKITPKPATAAGVTLYSFTLRGTDGTGRATPPLSIDTIP